MSAGFGWSLSDVVLLAKTTHKITAALREDGGASSEFQKTSRSLESLRLTFTEIHTLLVNSDSRFRNAIRAQVDDSSSSIAAFNNTLQKKYGRALSSTAPKGAFSGAWQKARWALLAVEDIAAFQAELSENTVTANRDLLAAAAIENRIHANEVISEVLTAHKDLKSSLLSLEGTITASPGLLQLTPTNQKACHQMETQMINLHHDLDISSSNPYTTALAHHELVLSAVNEQRSQLAKIDQNNVDMHDGLKLLLDRMGSSQKADLMGRETLLDGLADITLSVQSLKLHQADYLRRAQSEQVEHNVQLVQAIEGLSKIVLNPQSSQTVCLNSRNSAGTRTQASVSLCGGLRLGQLLASW
ncbi:MAG: hypothetical protein M1830_000759 [Pleopsidium flavum]|nr:MAG: hypothetical protein M1830_000759 [Pleopsidium flavum]